MGRYESENCPICNKPLENGEDIVVCPQCGAPYHRDCYKTVGDCIYTDLHQQNKDWQTHSNESRKSENGTVCPQCGKQNPDMSIFCNSCGAPLADNANRYAPPNPGFGQNVPPSQGTPFGGMPFGGTPFGASPFGTATQSIDPNETIGENTVGEYAAATGQNSQYFIPRFKIIEEGKSKPFNLAAGIFQGFYYLYRKMYLWGILLILIELLLSVPSVYIMYLTVTSAIGSVPAIPMGMTVANNIFWFISLGVRIFLFMYTNTLYKKHIDKLIAKEKKPTRNNEEFISAITKKGSVNNKLIVLFFVGYMLLNIVSIIIMYLS